MTLESIFGIAIFGLFIYLMMKKGGGCCGGHNHGGQHDKSLPPTDGHAHETIDDNEYSGSCCGGHSHGEQHDKPLPPTDHHAQNTTHDNEKDPVCGMDVGSASSESEFHGRTYRFCSDKCKQLFDLNPNKYVGA